MLDAAANADLIDEIRIGIANETLELPTLPEVALEIRDAVENDTADAPMVARMVAKDPALSARLLQVANSPLYRGGSEVDSIQHAITRLGLKMVRSLVVSLAMRQIFQATSDTLDSQFRQLWDDSLQVAAISHMLAAGIPQLEREQAMLGGLLHNIGALPILTKIDEHYGFTAGETVVTHMLDELGPEIGTHILKSWNFPESLAVIPHTCVDPGYDSGADAGYADVVLAARLQDLAAKGRLAQTTDLSRVPAFAKIGLQPEILIVDMEGPAEEIAEVRSMLEG
jgi:HD-like signal output (HDOD) protein